MSDGLYIGGRTGTDPIEPVDFDVDDLTTHGVIVGMTGSGKTGFAVTLLEEVLLAGVPVIAIDPKGDLGNLALRFPDLSPEQFAPWVTDADVTDAGGDRTAAGAVVAERWRSGLAEWDIGPARIARSVEAADVTIFTPGSTTGVPLNVVGALDVPRDDGAKDTEAIRQEIAGYVTSLLTLAGEDADPVRSPATHAAVDAHRAVVVARPGPGSGPSHRPGARSTPAQARRVRPRHLHRSRRSPCARDAPQHARGIAVIRGMARRHGAVRS